MSDSRALKDTQLMSPPRMQTRSSSKAGTPAKGTPAKGTPGKRKNDTVDPSPAKQNKGSNLRELFTSPRKRMLEEPLLDENPDRFCMFPIKYPQIWEMYKKAEASFWTGESSATRLFFEMELAASATSLTPRIPSYYSACS